MTTQETPEPDWSVLIGYEPNTNRCACGATFRAHHKLVLCPDGRLAGVTKDPCPGCGSRTRVTRSSSPPETWTIKSDETETLDGG